MNEANEVAENMRQGYAEFLHTIGLRSRRCLAREYTRAHMPPGESETVIDNVSEVLFAKSRAHGMEPAYGMEPSPDPLSNANIKRWSDEFKDGMGE